MFLICVAILNFFFAQIGHAFGPAPEAVKVIVLPEVSEEPSLPDIALIDTALHSVQQELHQMRHTINYTARHTCVAGRQNVSANESSTCLKAKVLINLLKEAEEVAKSLDMDTYYFQQLQFSPREVTSLLLQGLGLLGAAILFGYLSFYAMAGIFVSAELLFEILPFLFAKATLIPFFFIVVDVIFFGYFMLGSFSLLVVLASVVESFSFVFAHNPLVLECMGVATFFLAMLSLSKPINTTSTFNENFTGKMVCEEEEEEEEEQNMWEKAETSEEQESQ